MSLEVNVTKRFDGFTLHAAFTAGDTATALLGASGCGKSMTLRCIAGIVRPDEGRIVLDGRVLFDSAQGIDLPPQQRNVGLLFQNYALFPNMTVEQNILCALKKEKDPAARRAACAEALRAMRLEELAKRLPGILPPLTREEAVETTKIYSIAGQLPKGRGLISARPFRSPHHSASAAALAGGGAQFRPGECSLANCGVLFLDELPEFSRDTLEVLRQPLEDGAVTVSRVHGTATYPCRFMLVAAMNPCKCGHYGSGVRECSCTPSAIERYRQRISGPLLDRIDLHVEARPVEYDALAAKTGGEPSADIRTRVAAVRAMQAQRYQGLGFTCNAQLPSGMLRRYCPLAPAAEKLLRGAFERMGYSARAYDRILRVARTIADMNGVEQIGAAELMEALQYRRMDRAVGK